MRTGDSGGDGAERRATLEAYRRNYLQLIEIAPDLPWLPVVQGWERDDYERHLLLYRRAGVPVDRLSLVGLGSVCRRQHAAMVEELVRDLAVHHGLRLHGFGIKTPGLSRCGRHLASADSIAWSLAARFAPPLAECVGRHVHCVSCPRYALAWRETILRRQALTFPRNANDHIA